MIETNVQAQAILCDMAAAGEMMTMSDLYAMDDDHPLRDEFVGSSVEYRAEVNLSGIENAPVVGPGIVAVRAMLITPSAAHNEVMGRVQTEDLLSLRTSLQWEREPSDAFDGTTHEAQAFYEISPADAVVLDGLASGIPVNGHHKPGRGRGYTSANWRPLFPDYSSVVKQQVDRQRGRGSSPIDEDLMREVGNHRYLVVDTAKRRYPYLTMLVAKSIGTVGVDELPIIANHFDRHRGELV